VSIVEAELTEIVTHRWVEDKSEGGEKGLVKMVRSLISKTTRGKPN
jgi:hypothetical protein